MNAETFLKELKCLIASYPKGPTHIDNSDNNENCEYCDYVFQSKDLYYCFDNASCENCIYTSDSFKCVNSIDCDYAVESQLCYECIDLIDSYNCSYLNNCARMQNSQYCYACRDCKEVFGCVGLRKKSFCVFNRQLTEEEYHKTVEKYKKLPPEKILEMLSDLAKRYPLAQTNEAHNENSSYGNFLYYNKNCYLSFDAAHSENCAYMYDSFYNKHCYDTTYSSHNELGYELVDDHKVYNCNFTVFSGFCQDSNYLFGCRNVKNSLGCVNLKHKQYCILNRQLTKEEYERLSGQILQDLKIKKLGWGDITY